MTDETNRPAENDADTDRENESRSDDTLEVVESVPVAQKRTAGILEEALVQLRKMSDQREQALRRQEEIVGEMREAAERHGRTHRRVLTVGVGILLLALLALVGLFLLGRQERQTQAEVASLAVGVESANGLIRRASDTQSRQLDDVGSKLSDRIRESVTVLREERDAVQAEVRAVLDGQTTELVGRELALRAEAEKVKQDAERARQERLRIIEDAISRLEMMAVALEDSEAAEAGEAVQGESRAVEAPDEVDAADDATQAEAEVEAEAVDAVDAADAPGKKAKPAARVKAEAPPAPETPADITPPMPVVPSLD